MKSKKILAAVLLAVVMLMATTALAVEADTQTTEAKIQFIAGELKLTQVPNLYFGTHAVSSTTSFNAIDDSVMQVSDLRGSNAGWKVTLSLEEFPSGVNGVSISLNGGAVTPDMAGTLPTINQTITVQAGGAEVDLTKAATNSGNGIWNTSWTAANTSIYVPSYSQLVGTHTANLVWTLTDAP